MLLLLLLLFQEFVHNLEKNDLVGNFLRAERNHQELVRDNEIGNGSHIKSALLEFNTNLSTLELILFNVYE